MLSQRRMPSASRTRMAHFYWTPAHFLHGLIAADTLAICDADLFEKPGSPDTFATLDLDAAESFAATDLL